MLTITNTQAALRGFNAVSGPMVLEPGQTVKTKVYKREKEHIEATGWFEIEGSFDSDPDKTAAPAPAADGNAASIAALTEQVSALTTALANAMSGRPAQQAPSVQENGAPATLTAEHRGGGRYFIMDGGEPTGEAMTKDDAEAFNALSDEEKAKFAAKS